MSNLEVSHINTTPIGQVDNTCSEVNLTQNSYIVDISHVAQFSFDTWDDIVAQKQKCGQWWWLEHCMCYNNVQDNIETFSISWPANSFTTALMKENIFKQTNVNIFLSNLNIIKTFELSGTQNHRITWWIDGAEYMWLNVEKHANLNHWQLSGNYAKASAPVEYFPFAKLVLKWSCTRWLRS